jgi:hypothetical protein
MSTNATILRLRRANPVPTAPDVDGSELFARITASQPDARLRSESPRRRRALVLVVALIVMALLASTAFAISGWLGDAVKPNVTRQEYRAAQGKLTLPPGSTWPALHVQANSLTGRGAGGGHAVLAAQNAWECYWVQAIRKGDTAAQTRAHDVLNALLANNVLVAPAGASENWTPPNPPDHPFATFADDGGLQWVRATYALAAAGHPQRLIDSCRANAPG